MFMKVYEELSCQPYSLHFFLQFSKEIIRNQEQYAEAMQECMDMMRRGLKAITDDDIELFLYFNSDVAIQMVNDLIDEPNNNLNDGALG